MNFYPYTPHITGTCELSKLRLGRSKLCPAVKTVQKHRSHAPDKARSSIGASTMVSASGGCIFLFCFEALAGTSHA